MNPIIVSHVWKRYQIGSQHHSLRDAIPAVVGSLFKRNSKGGASLKEDEFWALKDVSFEVHAGETLGIIGRNGAGKSTLLKLLSGIAKQTKGEVHVRGKLAALIEVGAGFHPDLTGRENVYLNGTILGLKRNDINRLFDKIVEFAELESFIDTPVKRYSSGMYVRLGFAIAAHIDPDILLIDEVLAVGDLSFQQKCMQRIHDLKQQGKTIVFISHNLNAVQKICDRAILLNAGRISEDGDVAKVIRAYREQVVSKEKRYAEKAIAREESRGQVRAVTIDSIKLYDANGEEAETFDLGGPVTIEIAYTCNRRIEQPTVTVGIDRIDALLCHTASAPRDGATVPALEGRGTIKVSYPAMNLLPNTYRVNVEIGEVGSAIPHDRRQYGGFFAVSSTEPETGVVHLDHTWEWEGGSK